MNFLQTMARNKHTSLAGVVAIAAGYLSEFGCTWFPGHCEQLRQSSRIVAEAAVAYGLLMAGDASKPGGTPDVPNENETKSNTDTMKKIGLILITGFLVSAFARTASAQTPVILSPAAPLPPPSPAVVAPGLTLAQEGTFIQTVQSYFTSFDTNSLTFHKTNEFDVFAGADTQSGVTSASLGINYSLWRNVSLDEVTRGAGIGGVILSQQLGVGVSKVYYDVKLTAYVDGGYSFERKSAFAEFGVRAFKSLTANTFLGAGLALQADRSGLRQSPVGSLFMGFTF